MYFLLLVIFITFFIIFKDELKRFVSILFPLRSGETLFAQMLAPTSEIVKINDYKRFGLQLKQLIEFRKIQGISIESAKKDLKESLELDLKVERRIQRDFIRGLLQFFIFSTITWSFSLFLVHEFSLNLHDFNFKTLIFFHILAPLIYLILFQKIKISGMREGTEVLGLLITIKTQIQIGRAQNSIDKQRKHKIRKKNYLGIKKSLNKLLISHKELGVGIGDEVNSLISVNCDYLKLDGQSVMGRAQFISFLISLVFYLLPYLWLLFRLFSLNIKG